MTQSDLGGVQLKRSLTLGPPCRGTTVASYRLTLHFYRAMLCIRMAYADVRCSSVRPSVTFVYCIETSNRILKLDFATWYVYHSTVSTPNVTWRYSDRDPLTKASNANVDQSLTLSQK